MLLKQYGLGFQKRLCFDALTLSKGVKAAESAFVILLMCSGYSSFSLSDSQLSLRFTTVVGVGSPEGTFMPYLRHLLLM